MAVVKASSSLALAAPGKIEPPASAFATTWLSGQSVLNERLSDLAGMAGLAFVGGALLAVGVTTTEKTVPNPNGRKGDGDHQAGVDAAERELQTKYKDAPGVDVKREVKVDTPNGSKGARYLDVGAVGGEPERVIEGTQVGRTTKAGIPVSRERDALRDIARDAPWIDLGFRDSKAK